MLVLRRCIDRIRCFQLIARIHTQSPHVRRLIHQLLADIGQEHPQALIYPLTVASKSVNLARKKAALSIMDKMRSHSAALVDQVSCVCRLPCSIGLV